MTRPNHPEHTEPTRPSARPAAPTSDSASAPLTAPQPSLAEANTSSFPRTTPTRPETTTGQTTAATITQQTRVGGRGRSRLRADLQDRDRAVLASLLQHRFLTSHHLQALHFSGHASDDAGARAARRTLTRLEAAALIRLVDQRRVGGLGGGSTVATWYLTDAGYKVLTGNRNRFRIGVPTTRFLRHTLAIADAHLAIRAAANAVHGNAETQVERQAIRQMTGIGGERITIAPDLYAAIHGTDKHGDYEDHWFVEVDCGTESIPTLVRKCEQYEAYYRSGTEQADGGAFPLVLWIFHGTKATARLTDFAVALPAPVDSHRSCSATPRSTQLSKCSPAEANNERAEPGESEISHHPGRSTLGYRAKRKTRRW